MSNYVTALILIYGIGVFLGFLYSLRLWIEDELDPFESNPFYFVAIVPITTWATCKANNFTLFGKCFCTGIVAICCLPIMLFMLILIGIPYFLFGVWKNLRPLFIKEVKEE